MDYKLKKVTTFYSDVGLYEIVKNLAWYDRRSISSQIVEMLKESLIARKSNDTIPDELKEHEYLNTITEE